jgi:cation transport ATPase
MGEQVRRMEADGATVVLVAAGQTPVAAFSVTDPVKTEAAGVIAALSNMNIECHMVTGDNWPAARKVADRLGITKIMAEALPEAKAAKVGQDDFSSQNSRSTLVSLSKTNPSGNSRQIALLATARVRLCPSVRAQDS